MTRGGAGSPSQVSAQDQLPGYLLSWHLFKPRVLLQPLPKSSRDLVDYWDRGTRCSTGRMENGLCGSAWYQ